MDEQQETKQKRRQKQLYFGKRDDQLWEWVQSMPSGEGNAEICAILNYYLFGGVKPKTPSYWEMVEKRKDEAIQSVEGVNTKQEKQQYKKLGLDDDMIR